MVALLVSLAGALGAVARVVLDGELNRWFAPSWPWATVVINTLGCLVVGVLAGAVAGNLQLVLAVGWCGGFTTFSTAGVEAALLLGRGRWGTAVVHVAATALLGLGACLLGLLLSGG